VRGEMKITKADRAKRGKRLVKLIRCLVFGAGSSRAHHVAREAWWVRVGVGVKCGFPESGSLRCGKRPFFRFECVFCGIQEISI